VEQWKPVVGFEDYYEVSDQGRLRSLERVVYAPYGNNQRTVKPRILKPSRRAYLSITFSVDGVLTYKNVHVVVLEAFAGLRPQGTQTRHLNGINYDNRLTNLVWGTAKENHADMVVHGVAPIGAKNGRAKLSDAEIRAIRTNTTSSRWMLAEQYGVTTTTIGHIINQKGWTHV
jgi:hypothetical protein